VTCGSSERKKGKSKKGDSGLVILAAEEHCTGRECEVCMRIVVVETHMESL